MTWLIVRYGTVNPSEEDAGGLWEMILDGKRRILYDLVHLNFNLLSFSIQPVRRPQHVIY